MKHYSVHTGKGELNSASGNHLCGLMLEKHVPQSIPSNFQPRRSDAISDREILLTGIGLLCNGRSDFNDVELYRGDELFMNAYGLKTVASEAVFRQRFDELPSERTHDALRRLNAAMLSKRPLGRVNAEGLELIPVDIDVSPLDNSGSLKQGVSLTYKKYAGYAPSLPMWAPKAICSTASCGRGSSIASPAPLPSFGGRFKCSTKSTFPRRVCFV